MNEARQACMDRLKATLTQQQIDDIKIVIETAEASGDWVGDGESGSCYQDDVASTLSNLAREIRRLGE